MNPTARLEFSFDPLTDTTPTYVDVTADMRSITWRAGVGGELDDPQTGGATIRMKNRDRRYEPEYDGWPSWTIDTGQRWRLFLNDGAGEVQQGLWYADDFAIDYPTGGEYSEIVITLVDGQGLLAQDELGLLDPPEAATYEEVVMHDQPFAYYRCNDVDGTQLKAATGPDMVITGRPVVNQPALIVGDTDKSIVWGAAAAVPQYARAPIEAGQFGDTNRITVGGWFRPQEAGIDQTLLRGPKVATTDLAFRLGLLSTNQWSFEVVSAAGLATQVDSTSTAAIPNETACVFGTWDGQTARIYVNGVMEAETSNPLTVGTGATELFIWIGQTGNSPPVFYGDEIEFHETCLSAGRVLARYQAGAERGFPQQTAGERIAAVCASPLWGTTRIQAGHFDVQPAMRHGQPPTEELLAAVRAEGPRSLFFFDGEGQPVYLGWEYKATGTYNTVQAVFGDDGLLELPYSGIEPHYDKETFNDVTHAREGGVAQRIVNQPSIDKRGRRSRSVSGLINADDADVYAGANATLKLFAAPTKRFETITPKLGHAGGIAQLVHLEIGELVRVKKSGEVGDRIDRVTHVLGYAKTLDVEAQTLRGTFSLSRGFDAAAGLWRAGIVGFSEAGVTTRAA